MVERLASVADVTWSLWRMVIRRKRGEYWERSWRIRLDENPEMLCAEHASFALMTSSALSASLGVSISRLSGYLVSRERLIKQIIPKLAPKQATPIATTTMKSNVILKEMVLRRATRQR
ncbi:hypothetical protein Mag101_08110 [Microbulbifer agarilyticus]|uniref:Uncharacterized protein n=1 Tax=Microbulbifer agarilyticus TaxID=260552 RepID=A0A1Q2M4M3_9GAMM|nr:hypothetical protein Mag101_08110 [Microbulbifer agarilyticus]